MANLFFLVCFAVRAFFALTDSKRYLVVSELKGTGFFIGYYPTVGAAENAKNELINKYGDSSGEGKELYEQKKQYHTYTIHYSQQLKQKMISGIYNAYVIDTEQEGFTLDKFLFDRGNTILAFNVMDYRCEANSFAKFFIEFTANQKLKVPRFGIVPGIMAG